MRNTWVDNIQEHSLQVAMIAHALAVIRNRLFAGKLNPERVPCIRRGLKNYRTGTYYDGFGW